MEKAKKRSFEIKSDLQAINIGELDMTDDGTTAEDVAWDGEDDPFYHLTPGERMEVLRTMSLQDIYKSAVNRKEQNQKRKRGFGGSRKGTFKRPDAVWKRNRVESDYWWQILDPSTSNAAKGRGFGLVVLKKGLEAEIDDELRAFIPCEDKFIHFLQYAWVLFAQSKWTILDISLTT